MRNEGVTSREYPKLTALYRFIYILDMAYTLESPQSSHPFLFFFSFRAFFQHNLTYIYTRKKKRKERKNLRSKEIKKARWFIMCKSSTLFL